ncbi:MAG: PAS domain-containing protein, partial [Clostridia bacterium]|nr:PAS domain-containing protein [Clostridia bacterium]
MKTLLLVAKRRAVWDMYYRELETIFHGYLNIIPYLHEDDGQEFSPDSGIERADLVLITNPYSFPRARRRMREDAKIINLDFAFSKERVEALKEFPVGTEALVCFNFYSTAHQAVNALYAAGVTNLNLYIHYPGNQNVVGKRMELAVVSNGADDIPPEIPRVFDLGARKIAMSTLLDIAVKANVLDGALERTILKYCDTISTPDDYLAYFYDNSASSTMQLRAITECIDYGIVLFDPGWRVISCNERFRALFAVGDDLTGRPLEDLPWEKELRRFVKASEPCRNKLLSTPKPSRSLLVSKEKINKGDDRLDLFMLLFKDVTELTNLELSLRKQLAKRGHVARYTFEDIGGASA